MGRSRDQESAGWAPGLMVVGVAVGLAMVLSLGVAFVVSPGGAPQRPGHGSWVDQAHTSLEAVGSDVATAQLLVRLAGQDRVMGNYQQIVALDNETAAGKVADHFSGEQPEPDDQATYKNVTTVLSDAADLLTTVRIAVVRRETSRYPALEHAMTKMQARISQAEGQVPS
jgi:hypothetical protein